MKGKKVIRGMYSERFPEKFGLKKIIQYLKINKGFGLPVFRKRNLYGNESQKSYLFLWSKYFIRIQSARIYLF